MSLGELYDYDTLVRGREHILINIEAISTALESERDKLKEYDVQIAKAEAIMEMHGDSATGNTSAVPVGLDGVEGRVWVQPAEAQVFEVADATTVSITATNMTDAGYADGDRLDLVIYQMYYPHADSTVPVR